MKYVVDILFKIVSKVLTIIGWGIKDEVYLKMQFYLKMHRKLNVKNPVFYNDKLQWLKLNDRNPMYTQLVDKIEVKKIIADKIGSQYIIPTYKIWNKVSDVDFAELPNQFVLKTNHSGGNMGVVICRSKDSSTLSNAVKRMKVSLKDDIYKRFREWPYKDVKKRVFAEKLLVNNHSLDLVDYKVLCFGGQAKLIEVHTGRNNGIHTQEFYNTDWTRSKITQSDFGPITEHPLPKPCCLEKMLELSNIISEGIEHCRVDWYVCNNELYFGEITFYDGSGFEKFDELWMEELLGSWIQISNVKKL